MKINEKTMQKTSLVVGLAVLANMLWGSAAPIIKIGYGIFQIASDDIASQILFAGIRFFSGRHSGFDYRKHNKRQSSCSQQKLCA